MAVLLAQWDLPTIVNIITAAAVALAVPFALLQLHYANRARRNVAAVAYRGIKRRP